MSLAMMASGSAAAQSGTADPSARLAKVLPASAAQQVIALMKSARADGLPADALANRSLKFAARGIAPASIVKAASEQLARMRSARDVLRGARGRTPSGAEIEAGAEALREGVRTSDVAALAKGAPAGRSIAVPLYVVGSLVNAGVPEKDAMQRVASKLQSHASDADIESTGRDAAASHRPADGRGDGAGPGHSGGVSAPAHSASPPAPNHGPPAGSPGGPPSGNGAAHGRPPGQSNAPHGRVHGHP